ncbi:metallophosphoesterase [Anaerocolumna sp.]|uniref:metallophosphoesterase n=1 Tax=Anaerocolumna sp. TaxID=2041569 RepID=UPI0028A7CE37|nr:metallophosphoesterase [Anaerocolumna sp.]
MLIFYGFLVFGVLFLIYMYLENFNLQVTNYAISSKGIPNAFDDVSFVVLADLHNNSFGRDNERLINKINKANPNFIVIAGDLIVGKEQGDFSVALSLMEKLTKQYPVYYGFGNHEQRVMEDGTHHDESFNSYIRKLKDMGVRVINNETCTIYRKESKINITSVEIGKEYFQKFKKTKMETEYLQKLVGIPDNKCYNILIAHNPIYFKTYINWGADLVLSGHLHGGIVRLPWLGGVISPQYELFPKYDAGEFHENGQTMLVSRGLGTHTIKLRAFNRPELMVVTLKRP